MQPHLLILSGSGLSADSGLATFRGAGGLWEGRSVQDLATPEAWRRDPAGVWAFYQARRAALGAVQPNPAHLAMARLERELGSGEGGRATLVTQNVDDLHERAGSRALHMHGELANLRCERCGEVIRDLLQLDPARFVPCPACAGPRLRPDVVWFGEIPRHLDRIEQAVRACTHFLAVGTSGLVWPAAGILGSARASGARTIVVDLAEPANLAPEDEFVRGRAAEVLPPLLEELRRELLA